MSPPQVTSGPVQQVSYYVPQVQQVYYVDYVIIKLIVSKFLILLISLMCVILLVDPRGILYRVKQIRHFQVFIIFVYTTDLAWLLNNPRSDLGQYLD